MFRILFKVLGLIGAMLLMALLAFAAIVLSRSNPGMSSGWFFGIAGVLYTMTILFALSRWPQRALPARRKDVHPPPPE